MYILEMMREKRGYTLLMCFTNPYGNPFTIFTYLIQTTNYLFCYLFFIIFYLYRLSLRLQLVSSVLPLLVYFYF